MQQRDEHGLAIYRAGSAAPPGQYVCTDRECSRIVELDRPVLLPASLNGRIAYYRQLPVRIPIARKPESSQPATPIPA